MLRTSSFIQPRLPTTPAQLSEGAACEARCSSLSPMGGARKRKRSPSPLPIASRGSAAHAQPHTLQHAQSQAQASAADGSGSVVCSACTFLSTTHGARKCTMCGARLRRYSPPVAGPSRPAAKRRRKSTGAASAAAASAAAAAGTGATRSGDASGGGRVLDSQRQEKSEVPAPDSSSATTRVAVANPTVHLRLSTLCTPELAFK